MCIENPTFEDWEEVYDRIVAEIEVQWTTTNIAYLVSFSVVAFVGTIGT